MKRGSLLVMGALVAGSVGGVAVRASGADDESSESPTSNPPVATIEGLAVDGCPLFIGDYMVNYMYADGVTPEMVAEAERLRVKMVASDGAAPAGGARALTPEERRAEACAYQPIEEERHRRWMKGTEEADPAPPVPDVAICERFCGRLEACTGWDDSAAERPVCIASCRRGDFGTLHYLTRALELPSCDHL